MLNDRKIKLGEIFNMKLIVDIMRSNELISTVSLHLFF